MEKSEKSASKIPKVRGGVRGLWKKLIFKPHILRGKLPLVAMPYPLVQLPAQNSTKNAKLVHTNYAKNSLIRNEI